MTGKPRGDGTQRSATFRLDDVLKGEILSRLPDMESHSVEVMLVEARRRFAPHACWTIGALEVVESNTAGRGRLRAAFDEFRAGGGSFIIVITDRPYVATAFIQAAYNAGNIRLKVVKTVQDATAEAKAFRTSRPK